MEIKAYVEAVTGKQMISYAQLLQLQEAETVHSDFEVCRSFVVEPTYMTDKALGADCFASEAVTIYPGEVELVPTGIKAKFDGDRLGLFPFIRSSIPKKKGLLLANGVGVVESDYHSNKDNDGNICFMMLNFSDKPVRIERFERIGQLVLLPVERFTNAGYANKNRGASGSTGI